MVFQQMSDDEKDLYLDVLREGTTPFDRFVARGSMQDVVDIPGPRSKIDRFMFRAISQTNSDHSTRLIPIIGSAGSGSGWAVGIASNSDAISCPWLVLTSTTMLATIAIRNTRKMHSERTMTGPSHP